MHFIELQSRPIAIGFQSSNVIYSRYGTGCNCGREGCKGKVTKIRAFPHPVHIRRAVYDPIIIIACDQTSKDCTSCVKTVHAWAQNNIEAFEAVGVSPGGGYFPFCPARQNLTFIEQV